MKLPEEKELIPILRKCAEGSNEAQRKLMGMDEASKIVAMADAKRKHDELVKTIHEDYLERISDIAEEILKRDEWNHEAIDFWEELKSKI